MSKRDRADTVDQMVAALIRSALVTEDRAAALLTEYRTDFAPSSGMPDTVTAFCTYLVSIEEVTTWQCEKLRNGQWKGFFELDDYELLDKLGSDDEYGYYLGRHTAKGTFVRLAIRLAHGKSHRINFRIDHAFT
jgi:hypothetical protein